MRTQRLALAGGATFVALRAARLMRGYTFRDRVALITGGSRGLGLVLARQLLEAGAQVAICGRDDATLTRARDELDGHAPGRVHAFPCDLGDRDSVEAMVDSVLDRFGRIDVLINNAGQIQVGPAEEMNVADYEAAMKVHFWGPLYLSLGVLPEMKKRGDGRIVNISSIGGKVAVPHLLPYAASKFALTGFSEGLRAELAPFGIKVVTVCPGLMRTGSPRNASFKGRHRAEYAWFKLSDSLPGLSMSVERAAKKILAATRRGDAEVVLSVPAKLATLFHGLFPGVTARVMGVVNRALPRAGGIGQQAVAGRDSQSRLSESWATGLTDRAAAENNQL